MKGFQTMTGIDAYRSTNIPISSVKEISHPSKSTDITVDKTPSNQDTLSLSADVKHLNAIQQQMQNDHSDIDVQKIESIKAKIEQGQYHLDADLLAKKMITLD